MEKDEGYSSGDDDTQGMRSSVILSGINLSYGNDPNAYKKDKSCTICLKQFSLVGNKKHFCKFCFRGVCAGCSKHKALDSKGKNVRICDTCYQKAIQDQVKDSLQKELDKEKEEIQKIQASLEMEQKRRKHESEKRDLLERQLEELRYENQRRETELKEKSEKLKKEKKILEEDIQELTKILQSSDVEKKTRDEKLAKLKSEVSVFRSEAQSDIEKINALNKLIKEQEFENENLSKQLSSYTDTSIENDDPLTKTNLLENLKQKLSQSKDQYKDLKKENESLKKKLASLKEENTSKKNEISKLEEAGGRKRAISRISSDIKDLEDQIAFQEQEIVRLNEKLYASKSK